MIDFLLYNDIFLDIIFYLFAFSHIVQIIKYNLLLYDKDKKKNKEAIIKMILIIIIYFILYIISFFSSNFFIAFTFFLIIIITLTYTIIKTLKNNIDFSRNLIFIWAAVIFTALTKSNMTNLYMNIIPANFPHFYKELLLELFITFKLFFTIFFLILCIGIILADFLLIISIFSNMIYKKLRKIKVKKKSLITNIYLKLFSFFKYLSSKNTYSNIIKNINKKIAISFRISAIFSSLIIYSVILQLSQDNQFSKESKEMYSLVAYSILLPTIYDSLKNSSKQNKS